RLIREGQAVTTDDGHVPVELALLDAKEFDHRGVVDFFDSKLDTNSGTLYLRAVIDNPTLRSSGLRALSPGLFVRVRLPIGTPYKVLTVPEEALASDQGKKYLYVFRPLPGEANKTPTRRGTIQILREREERGGQVVGKLVLGPVRDGRRVIKAGLGPDEEII